jgi:hypothetical protein
LFGLTLAWDLFQLGLTMPILNRITGERQDLSQFAGLQGNLGALLIFLAVSWNLVCGAFGSPNSLAAGLGCTYGSAGEPRLHG